MDRGHNALEIRARVIAEEVYGNASGLSAGGGGSGIANKVGVSVPVMLGWSKSKTGKIALDGIQAELYERRKGIVFEDEAPKIKKQIEKIWDEQKKAVREKKEMDNLKAEVEKKRLLVEKKKLDRELKDLETPPKPQPQPQFISPPPPPPPPPAPKLLPPVPERMVDFVVYFKFDKWDILPGEMPKIIKLADWLKTNRYKVQVEGHCSQPGSFEYNAALGRRRAKEVYDALLAQGVPGNRVFQYVSVSKDRLASGKNEEDQRAIVRIIGPASGK